MSHLHGTKEGINNFTETPMCGILLIAQPLSYISESLGFLALK